MDAALAYAARGWAVFPLAVRGKIPMIPKHDGGRGHLDATTAPGAVRAWWRRWPNANIGVATGVRSGIDVLDVDPRHGGDVTLAALVRAHGAIPGTAGVFTGSGGRHFYFLHDARVRSSAGRLGAGLDVKGEGGYVVVPPSVHPDGPAYEWSPELEVLAPWPTWLLTLILPQAARERPLAPKRPLPIDAGLTAYGRAVLRRACEAIENAREGRRHEVLRARARAVGGFVAGGEMGEGIARDCLIAAALSAGLTEREAAGVVAWGLEHGAMAPLAAPEGVR
jgi:hypothetical protein